MDMTDNQRRWWFATHPEYRRSRRGNRRHGHIGSKDKPKRVDPRQVDEYVDHALQCVDGPVAEILRSTKRNFGTESQTAVPKKYLRVYLASDGSAYGQEADVQAMHDVYRASQQAIEEHRRKYAIGLEPDPHTFFDIIPYRGFITTPIQTLRSLLWNQVRGGVLNAVNKKTRRWRVGDTPLQPTRMSRIPSWTTQARRTWKNEAAKKGAAKKWKPEYLERMKRGRPPRRKNRKTGEWESMELHHHPVPRRDGGTEVIMVWPEEHARIDFYRRLKKRR